MRSSSASTRPRAVLTELAELAARPLPLLEPVQLLSPASSLPLPCGPRAAESATPLLALTPLRMLMRSSSSSISAILRDRSE